MSTTPLESQSPSPQPGDADQNATATPAADSACKPARFEEFDLDDIEVIESKVFA